jgi:hypothetical protein
MRTKGLSTILNFDEFFEILNYISCTLFTQLIIGQLALFLKDSSFAVFGLIVSIFVIEDRFHLFYSSRHAHVFIKDIKGFH